MLITVINPNTAASMTEKIGNAARAAAAPGTQIVCVNPPYGPVSIEDHYDEAYAVPGLLGEVRAAEKQGCAAYVIACFGDPGLDAAREIADGPVIGIAEAAMHAASFVSTGFSVVTTLERTCVMARRLADRYGFRDACRSVRGTDLPVLELENPHSGAYARILEECRSALAQDRSGAIVLGCAGMADLRAELSKELGVPVIDGVAAAVKFSEALVSLGIGTSKRGDYARPLPKKYTGAFADYAPQSDQSST
ncbi:MAG: aspartate/glutamate racemase family protein [Polaromonas sp.]|nr:aspartate/glutamate racemase family protein [Polaromonas sp.]